MNHYKILGLNRGANDFEIKIAFKKAVLKYHPAKNLESKQEEMFKKIGTAYKILSDLGAKKQYDDGAERRPNLGGYPGISAKNGSFYQSGRRHICILALVS
ncbi:MAG: J domain-containing protein [Silvanigrellaceae bacterium]|nr:J domain-containing protein [Silvanigrellaceae bacterium]